MKLFGCLLLVLLIGIQVGHQITPSLQVNFNHQVLRVDSVSGYIEAHTDCSPGTRLEDFEAAGFYSSSLGCRQGDVRGNVTTYCVWPGHYDSDVFCFPGYYDKNGWPIYVRRKVQRNQP